MGGIHCCHKFDRLMIVASNSALMSTFSKLKEDKSYTGKGICSDEESDAGQTSTSPMDVDRQAENLMVEVQPGSMRQKSYQPEGLYEALPRDLEIRVHMDETGKGRGIYNLRQRKPGRPLMDMEAAHCNDFPSNKDRQCPLVN